ncbi:MAG TPA: hypothetical protein VFI46_13520 [Jiangellaceae bacterium]|nr:hypothetical protein [Jiangellaceae bacterium]
MSQLPTVSSSGHPTGWALAGLLFVLVLGVIGMHGVGPHERAR